MKRIELLLKEIRRLPGTRIAVEYSEGRALLILPNKRSHVVEVRRQDGAYMMVSRVVGKAKADSFKDVELAERVWARNRHSGVVEFTLEKSGALVGRIEQIAGTLQKEELFYYLKRLAEECDRFEYVITGKDRY